MQSKYFPELQMKTRKIKRITTSSILNKLIPSLMYDFLMVVLLWVVALLLPHLPDWTEGNPEYFSNISHQTMFQIPMVKKMNSDVREDFLFSFSRFSDQ